MPGSLPQRELRPPWLKYFRDYSNMPGPYRLMARNFYGRLAVYDDADPGEHDDAVRKLLHGVVIHGQQPLREEYSRIPVSYFCPKSGIGLAMHADGSGAPCRIGVLGLGCGSLAAYGRREDTIRIYEINPLALAIAQSEFSYLRDSAANVEVALGDGRLSLEREPSQLFDLLVMDAFSGDSVPVHLLTRGAFPDVFSPASAERDSGCEHFKRLPGP
jgi:hypothetical protein